MGGCEVQQPQEVLRVAVLQGCRKGTSRVFFLVSGRSSIASESMGAAFISHRLPRLRRDVISDQKCDRAAVCGSWRRWSCGGAMFLRGMFCCALAELTANTAVCRGG